MTIYATVHGIGLALSFVIAFLLSVFFKAFKSFGADDRRGPQNIHDDAISRIGGLAVFIGFLMQAGILYKNTTNLQLLLILSTLPVFLAGFIEDITNKVSARTRFLASIVTGLLFYLLTGYSIYNIDIGLIDGYLSGSLLSILLTVFAVALLSNAMNIIDGLNGLAGGTALIICLATLYVFIFSNSSEGVAISLSLIVSLSGFIILNFPLGRIFLGDGGAYFTGAIIAALLIMLPVLNEQVSPFFCLLVVFYPTYELIRSAIRRFLVAGVHAFHPDNRHLHSVLFQYVSRLKALPSYAKNSTASILTLLIPLAGSCWAVMHYDDRFMLLVGLVLSVISYEIAYVTLRFWMKRSK